MGVCTKNSVSNLIAVSHHSKTLTSRRLWYILQDGRVPSTGTHDQQLWIDAVHFMLFNDVKASNSSEYPKSHSHIS